MVQDDLRRLLQRHGAPELPTTSCLQRQCEGRRIRSALGVEAEPFTRVAGPASLWLARPLGFDLPLSPLKGYSFTIPLTGGAASCLSVTDSKRMIVYARRGGNLRAAGIAPGPVGVAPLPKAGRFRVSPSENLWRVGFALACSTDQVIADLA